MKTFDNLKAGTRIVNDDGDVMEVLFWDFYGKGKKIRCVANGKSIWPISEFSPADWEVK